MKELFAGRSSFKAQRFLAWLAEQGRGGSSTSAKTVNQIKEASMSILPLLQGEQQAFLQLYDTVSTSFGGTMPPELQSAFKSYIMARDRFHEARVEQRIKDVAYIRRLNLELDGERRESLDDTIHEVRAEVECRSLAYEHCRRNRN